MDGFCPGVVNKTAGVDNDIFCRGGGVHRDGALSGEQAFNAAGVHLILRAAKGCNKESTGRDFHGLAVGEGVNR